MARITTLTIVALLAVAAPAPAATTVRVGDAFPPDPVQRAVLITDETGDANTLSISYTFSLQNTGSRGDAVVTVGDETATLQAGEGCMALGGNRVRCGVEEIYVVRALLGDGADVGTAASPPAGTTSCQCVEFFGGSGNDNLLSFDGATLNGEDGHDMLTGGTSRAGGTVSGLDGPSDDNLVGGAGNDTLTGGIGRDGLTGGSGDDVLQAGPGDDTLVGGEPFPLEGQNPSAGRDTLEGYSGRDTLDDGDDEGPEIGPDTLIGGRGVDTVYSYLQREDGIRVDLTSNGGDGEPGEGDKLENVEEVFGSPENDVLQGDGDANSLYGFGGRNRLRGRGGNDLLVASSLDSNVLAGDRGDDVLDVQAWTPGRASCGRGGDRVVQPPRGMDAPRHPRKTDPGITILGDCEGIARSTFQAWGIDPVPDRPVSGRLLTFDRPRGLRSSKSQVLVVTSTRRPYKELGRGRSTRRGITVRLPRRVAARARRRGMVLRAEVRDTAFVGPPILRMIWRFRVRPAR